MELLKNYSQKNEWSEAKIFFNRKYEEKKAAAQKKGTIAFYIEEQLIEEMEKD